MPPQQQRQLLSANDAQLLEQLRLAPSLSVWERREAATVRLCDVVCPSLQLINSTQRPQLQQLLNQLAAVTSHGLNLLCQSCDEEHEGLVKQPDTKLGGIYLLSAALGQCVIAWRERAPAADRAAASDIARCCRETGFLPVLASASSCVAATLQLWQQQQQQQRQQQRMPGLCVNLAHVFLDLWRRLTTSWPLTQELIANPDIAPTVPAVIALAAAVLRMWPAVTASSQSDGGSTSRRNTSSSASSKEIRVLKGAVDAAMEAAQRVICCFMLDFRDHSAAVRQTGISQLLSSSDMQLLLYTNLAWVARGLHQQQRGRVHWAASSSSSRALRQRQVPPAHDDLLAALGLAGYAVPILSIEADIQAGSAVLPVWFAVSDISQAIAAVGPMGQGSSSGSGREAASSIAVDQAQQQQQQKQEQEQQQTPGIAAQEQHQRSEQQQLMPTIAQTLCGPLVNTLIEVTLLQPDADEGSIGTVLDAIHRITGCIQLQVMQQWQRSQRAMHHEDQQQQQQQQQSEGQLRTAVHGVYQLVVSSIGPSVLQLLGPAVAHYLKLEDEQPPEEHVFWNNRQQLLDGWAALLFTLSGAADDVDEADQLLGAAFCSNPLTICAAVEAGTRHRAAAAPRSSAAQLSDMSKHVQMTTGMLQWALHNDHNVAEAIAAASSNTGLVLRLSSLLLSCCKYADRAGRECSGQTGQGTAAGGAQLSQSSIHVFTAAADVVKVGMLILRCCCSSNYGPCSSGSNRHGRVQSSSSSSSSSSRRGSKAESPVDLPWAAPLLVLVARALVVTGKNLASLLEVKAEDSHVVQNVLKLCHRTVGAFRDRLCELTLPADAATAGATAVAAAARQQQQQQGPTAVAEATPAAAQQPGEPAVVPGPALQQLLQQQEEVQDALRRAVEMCSNADGESAESVSALPPAAVLAELLVQLGLQLQQFGAAVLSELPLAQCCNNPGCINMSRLSELQLVSGKGSRCSRCKLSRYCSKDCQAAHWPQHKRVCKVLSSQ